MLILSVHTHLQDQIEYTIEQGWLGKKPLHEYNEGTTSQIVVNFFMGSKNDVVEYRIEKGPWQKMRYKEMLDLPPGEHTIEVKATDRYGKQHFGRQKYTILE